MALGYHSLADLAEQPSEIDAGFSLRDFPLTSLRAQCLPSCRTGFSHGTESKKLKRKSDSSSTGNNQKNDQNNANQRAAPTKALLKKAPTTVPATAVHKGPPARHHLYQKLNPL